MTQAYHPHADVLFREIGDESVLLNLSSGIYYGLDEVGTRIWRLVMEARTVDQICAQLLEEFEVARDVLDRDVPALLAQLVEKGLLTTGEAPSV